MLKQSQETPTGKSSFRAHFVQYVPPPLARPLLLQDVFGESVATVPFPSPLWA